MAKHLCPNTTSSQDNYAAPVPFVGLYIIAATLVCFLLMLCDVIHGFRHRKTWLPCRFFALNSVILTLLSVAAKLPVDLTTPMPGAYDQLSKLTGAAVVCVSMGYLLPSLGSNRVSECMTNVAAMTILVVTVIVNICIQMSTGIIFSFIPEHVIIMFCMLSMVLYLWQLTWKISVHKEIQMDHKTDILTKGELSMLERLKLCYIHAYSSEPQFVLCKTFESIIASCPCISCLVVILQATFRSLIGHKLEFCNGLSDYGWSIKSIVLTQILVILIASLAICFRWYVIYEEEEDLALSTDKENIDVIISNAPLLKVATSREYFHAKVVNATEVGYFLAIFFLLQYIFIFIITGLAWLTIKLCLYFFGHGNAKLEDTKEYKDLLKENGMVLAEWTLTKCVKDMKSCVRGSDKNNSSSHLLDLLSKRLPSQQSVEELNRQYGFEAGNEVSCLYLVFLVRVSSVSTLSMLNDHLGRSLGEVFDVIYFIDTKINSLKSNGRRKCKLARAMWLGEDLKIGFSRGSQSDLDHVLEVLKEVKTVLPAFVWNEVGIIMDFINGRECTSIQELYDYMEQLFVDMLHVFLIQFPHAILKELMECNAEEYEETARRMLKFLFQIKHLEDKVQWSFPVGSNISSLITTQAFVTNHHITSPVFHNDSNVVADHVIEVENQNVSHHEIVQVE